MADEPAPPPSEDPPWQPPTKADWHGHPEKGVLADDRHISDEEAEEALARLDAEATVPDADPDFDPDG